jgi:hypothetical protein
VGVVGGTFGFDGGGRRRGPCGGGHGGLRRGWHGGLCGGMEGDERQEKRCEGYSRSGLSDHADLVLLSGLWISGGDLCRGFRSGIPCRERLLQQLGFRLC